MSAGPTERRGLVAVVAVVAFGCDARSGDAPPPPSRYEIVSAPPGARGARAAGTEPAPGGALAPREPGAGDLEWGEPPTPVPDAQPDAGADGAEPPPPQGVPL